MGCGASAEVQEKKQYAFRVRLLGGLNLYNNGFGVQVPGTYTNAGRFEGSSDPYAVLECSGTKQRFESRAKMSTQNPVWNEEFYFNTSTKAPVLTITVKDYDVASRDDVLGVAKIELNGLLGKEKERVIWAPCEGATGRGEVGIAVIEAFRVHITAKQGINVKPMDTLSGSSDVYMTLQVGQQKAQQTATKGWTLNPVWNETKMFYLPYGVKSQVAMILYDHDSVGVNTQMGWHYEYFDGKPQEGKRQIEVPITNAQGKLQFDIEDDLTMEGVSDAPPVTESMKKRFPPELPRGCTVDVRVLGAYNLAAADANYCADFANDVNSWAWHEFKEHEGSSDSFARVTCEGVTYDTKHIDTLNPVWNEMFRFIINDREETKLNIAVMDKDLVIDDCIGQVEIPVKALRPGERQEIWSFLDKGRGEIGVEIKQHHQLAVRVIKAEGLPATDMNDMADPFVRLELVDLSEAASTEGKLGEQSYNTRVVNNDRNPWFEEDFRFCVPSVEGKKLRFEVWDSDLKVHDKIVSKDIIGYASQDVSNLPPGVPTSFELTIKNNTGAVAGTLFIEVTEEVPAPESALKKLREMGKEAYANAMKEIDAGASRLISLVTPFDAEKKQEAEYQVEDPKLAPRPRFGKMRVEVVGVRELQGVSAPWYVGVSYPLQGKRFKTREMNGARGADISDAFEFPIPTRMAGGIDFMLFESAKAPYTSWSENATSRRQLKFAELNGGDGLIRGSAADDEWLEMDKGGKVIVRVAEQYRFNVRIVGGSNIDTKLNPYVVVELAQTQFRTSFVPQNTIKDQQNRVLQKPIGTAGEPRWDEQFTFFSHEKGDLKFKLMDTGVVSDDVLAQGTFDLREVRRGVPHEAEIKLGEKSTLKVIIIEEEKMALLDRIIDAAANAQKLAASAIDEIGEAAKELAGDAAKKAEEGAAAVASGAAAIGGAIGGLFGK